MYESCTFRDEDDDCTYHYTVDNPKDSAKKDLEVQVLKKKGECLYFTSALCSCDNSSCVIICDIAECGGILHDHTNFFNLKVVVISVIRVAWRKLNAGVVCHVL